MPTRKCGSSVAESSLDAGYGGGFAGSLARTPDRALASNDALALLLTSASMSSLNMQHAVPAAQAPAGGAPPATPRWSRA